MKCSGDTGDNGSGLSLPKSIKSTLAESCIFDVLPSRTSGVACVMELVFLRSKSLRSVLVFSPVSDLGKSVLLSWLPEPAMIC